MGKTRRRREIIHEISRSGGKGYKKGKTYRQKGGGVTWRKDGGKEGNNVAFSYTVTPTYTLIEILCLH